MVGHFSKYQKPTEGDANPANRVKVIDSDIGRNVGFQRVAVHHIILPAQCSSSFPHAESLEEEFVLILKGQVDLWLNGFIYPLSEGHAVGFPAGTEIAHTFINNSNSDIQLLVAGDKTKKENPCSFPVNPELKENSQIWWPDSPTHELGPHSGLPGPIRPEDLGKIKPNCLIYCPDEPRRQPFHYPGDNETFGEGFRVTNRIGLSSLGIWYDYLPPGTRSAFPHAHTHEEEFVYILKGKPTVWLNGFTQELEPGWFNAVPPNTGIPHTLINDTDEDVIYLCIGETKNFPDEKLTYPLNPLRINECLRKKWYWTDAPELKMGDHNGRPKKKIKDHLYFRICTPDDAKEVLAIFKESPTYFKKVDGCLPSEKTAMHAIVDGPKNQINKYFKEFLIIYLEDKPIGVLDLHANHPEEGICYLGLLLIREDLFARGLGTRCFQLAEDYIKRALGCSKIRLGISDENDVTGFWENMGFKPNGKNYEWKGEAKSTKVSEFDKLLVVPTPQVNVRLIDKSDHVLAQGFYESVGYCSAIQPSDIVVAAFEETKMIGVVRLAHEEGIVVLRGMKLAPDFQRRGIGSKMLDVLNEYFGVGECFCLPHGWLEGFYGQIGFRKIPDSEAPPHLRDRLRDNRQKYPNLIAMRRPPVQGG